MAEPSPPRTVDVHTHYLATELAAALTGREEMPRIAVEDGRRTIQYGPGSGHQLYDEMTDIEAQLELMAAAGIDFAVISVNVPGVDWFPPAEAAAIARAVNDELADLGQAHPERLAALAILPMGEPEVAAEELRRAAAAGLRGGVVFSNIAGEELDLRHEVVFAAAAELDLPILIHPTVPLSGPTMDSYALISTVGFLVDTTTAALRLILGGIYERHPELKLYLPHAASLLPQLAGRIDVEAARMPGGMGRLTEPPSEQIKRLYSDVVCAWPPALRSCVELLGPERMMFGTDFPFWRPRQSFDTLAEAAFESAVEAEIRAGTAERLFRIARAG